MRRGRKLALSPPYEDTQEDSHLSERGLSLRTNYAGTLAASKTVKNIFLLFVEAIQSVVF